MTRIHVGVAEHASLTVNIMIASIRLYLSRQASSLVRYIFEQLIIFLFGWIPTIIGIAIRSIIYRLILRIN